MSKTSYIFLISPYSSVKGAKSNFEREEEICSFCYCTSGYLGPSANTDYIGIYLGTVAQLHDHSSLWTGVGSECMAVRRAGGASVKSKKGQQILHAEPNFDLTRSMESLGKLCC